MHQGISHRFFFFNRSRFRRERADLVPFIWVLGRGHAKEHGAGGLVWVAVAEEAELHGSIVVEEHKSKLPHVGLSNLL